MALLWVDGFDKYSADADLNIRYSRSDGNATFQAAAGKFGAGAVRIDGTAAGSFNVAFPAVAHGGILHVAFWVDLSALTSAAFLSFLDLREAASGDHGNLFYNPSKQLVMEQYGPFSNGALGNTSGDPLSVGYHHFEIAFKVDNSAGIAKMWIDNSLVINFSGDTLVNAGSGTGIDQLRFYDPSSGGNMDIDDLVIWDESGSDFTMTQLGAHKIVPLTPDGAGNSTQFTPSAGSNFQNVDDDPFHDTDATYNESTTTTHKDLYAMTPPAAEAEDIWALAVHNRAKQAGGAANIRTTIRSASTEAETANQALAAGYGHHAGYFGEDPATSAQWLHAAMAGVEGGLTLQTGAGARVTQTYIEILRSEVDAPAAANQSPIVCIIT